MLLAALLLSTGGAAASAQPALRSDEALSLYIDEQLDEPAYDNAMWGVLVVDETSGAVLYSRNPGKSFLPASNTKLYTAAAALEQLGPDYRYRTRVYASGPVEDGVLRGSIIVRGAGDPTIGGYEQRRDPTAIFEAWADSLKAVGIQRISGDIIGDDDVMDDTPLGHGWSWDDETYYYSAEAGGLVFNENVIDLTLTGQEPGRPAEASWVPYNTSYVRIRNRSRTVPSGQRIDEEYKRERGTNTIVIETEVPAGRTEREALTITNPTRYFAYVLREALVRNGIKVDGEPLDLDDENARIDYGSPRMRLVATYTSEPLSAITATMMKESNNLYAEQILRTLAAERPRTDLADEDLDPGSAEMGLRAAMRTFARAGLDTLRLQLVDGSGLSRQNYVTPAMTVALLRYMRNHPDEAVRSAFYAALPVGGRDGTLRYRFRRGAASGRVRAKTGTLSNTSALSGYVSTADGRTLAFSLMCNSVTVEDAEPREVQEQIVNALAAARL